MAAPSMNPAGRPQFRDRSRPGRPGRHASPSLHRRTRIGRRRFAFSSPPAPIVAATRTSRRNPSKKAHHGNPTLSPARQVVRPGGRLHRPEIALQSVSGIVDEREGRLREAERSVAASLAAAQTLVGPVLERDCSETWEATQGEGKDRKTVTERRDFKLSATPATLDVKGDVAIEPRHRGIFKVNGYVLKARLVAAWKDGTALVPEAWHADSRLHCDSAGAVRRPRRRARRAQRGDADRRHRRAGARRHPARGPSAWLPRRCRRVVRGRASAAARRGRH